MLPVFFILFGFRSLDIFFFGHVQLFKHMGYNTLILYHDFQFIFGEQKQNSLFFVSQFFGQRHPRWMFVEMWNLLAISETAFWLFF